MVPAEKIEIACFHVMDPRKYSTVIERGCVGPGARRGFLWLEAEEEKGEESEGWHSNATTTGNESNTMGGDRVSRMSHANRL